MTVPNHSKERRKQEDSIKTNDFFSNRIAIAVLTAIFLLFLFIVAALLIVDTTSWVLSQR